MAITRALHQGEESLLELTKQVCCFLQVCFVYLFFLMFLSPLPIVKFMLDLFLFDRMRLTSLHLKSFL